MALGTYTAIFTCNLLDYGVDSVSESFEITIECSDFGVSTSTLAEFTSITKMIFSAAQTWSAPILTPNTNCEF